MYSIRPFNEFDLTNDLDEARWQRDWNRKLSSLCIFVKHAFGRLKGRFPLLHGMTGFDLLDIFWMVEVAMILHNVLEEFSNDPTTIKGFNGIEDKNVNEVWGEGPVQMAEVNANKDDLYCLGLLWWKNLVDYSMD